MTKFKQLGGDADWWRGGVIYQIYPRSYQDSSNIGIGDLRGITKRFDHIASLGVDGVWISPFFTSPMKDFGYDVSNYRDIDPMFGTLDDFDAMIARAHELGLRIIIDLVMSHTSDEHPWFAESRASRDNPKSDWYVWADPQDDGTPPNNWLSIFGGSAWQWDARREQYYMHNFLREQPDLNLHNPEVQDELLAMTKFWLDRGVDGFRLDTINFYFHDQELRSNPALPRELRNSTIAPSVNPYNHQEHLYDRNRPENMEFLKRFRALLDEYPATTAVGEIGDAQLGLKILGDYTRGYDRMHMSYAFEFLSGETLTPGIIKTNLDRFADEATGGAACWAFSNHDVVRHPTRWSLDDARIKLINSVMMALPGCLCIYQGEEFGFRESDVAFEDLQDPYGIEFWPEFKGRDGCRTPIPWEASAHGGFTGNAKPWLPVDPAHIARIGETGDDSIIAHYREMIALRRAHPALQSGRFDVETIGENGLIIHRELDGNTVTGYFNFSDDAIEFSGSGDVFWGDAETANGAIKLDGKSAVFLS